MSLTCPRVAAVLLALLPAAGAAAAEAATAAWTPRGDWVFFADPGGGLVGMSGNGSFGATLHTGLSGRWLFAQATGEARRVAALGSGNVGMLSAGADIGLLSRLVPGLELRVGLGALRLRARETGRFLLPIHSGTGPVAVQIALTRTTWKNAATAFAGVTFVTASAGTRGLRGRLGLELRSLLGSTVAFREVSGSGFRLPPETVNLGSLSVVASVGFELPVSGGAP